MGNWTKSHGVLEFDLREPAPSANDAFSPIGFYRDKILCGAVGEDTTVVDSGAVYVFSRTDVCDLTWELDQGPIKASDPANNGFGAAGGMDRNFFVVGALGADGEGAAYAFRLEAGTWVEKQKIQPADLAAGDDFGADCQVFENTIIVGAPGQNGGAGAVYIFTTADGGATWLQQAKITASNAEATDAFGSQVDLFKDTCVVSAPFEDGEGNAVTDGGAVYVFTRTKNAWSEQQIIRGSDTATLDEFGNGISLTNGVLCVGAYLHNGQRGACYVFRRAKGLWAEEQKVVASDAAIDDFFGRSVALRGDSILVGAFGRDDFQAGAGTVYVFSRESGTWVEQSRMAARTHTGADRMGRQVFLHDTDGTAVVGADGMDSSEGACFVYKPQVVQPFFGSLQAANDGVGIYCDIDGDLAVISGVDFTTPKVGRAYALKRNAITGVWEEKQVLVGSDSAAGDNFGRAVSISGDTIVCTAPDHSAGRGALYVFETSDGGDSWSEVIKLQFPGIAAGDRLGNSVSIQGNTIVTAAANRTGFAGEGEIYQKAAGVWGHVQSIPKPGGGVAQFGQNVSFDGNTCAFNAPAADAGFPGASYAFVRPSNMAAFVFKQKLVPQVESRDASDFFGIPMIVRGDTIVCSGQFTDGPANGNADIVGVWVFRSSDNWTSFVEEAVIRHPDLETGDRFGSEVIISDTDPNVMMISATEDDDYDNGLSNSGVFYLYTRSGTTWTFRRKFRTPDRNALDAWAGDVGRISGSTFLSGAFGADCLLNAVNQGGTAYFYDIGDPYAVCIPEPDPDTVQKDDPETATASSQPVDKLRQPFDDVKRELESEGLEAIELKRTINDKMPQAALITKAEYDALVANSIKLPPKTRTKTITETFLREHVDTIAENVCGQVLEPGSGHVSDYSKRRRLIFRTRVPAGGQINLGYPITEGPAVIAKERPSGLNLTVDTTDPKLGVVSMNVAEIGKLVEISHVTDDFLIYHVVVFGESNPSLTVVSDELHKVLLEAQV